MDLLIHISLIVIMTGLFFLLRWSENPFIYAGVLVLSLIGLIMSVTTGVYYIEGETNTYTYQDGCINSTDNKICIEKITIEPNKTDLGIWKYVFDLSYLGYLIGSIIFWTYSNRREEQY